MVEVEQDTPQPKEAYQDEFQTTVGDKIEELGEKFVGKGRTILYGIGALVFVALLMWGYHIWSNRTNNAAQAALGKAIETSQALVSDAPVLAGVTYQTFKTEKARSEAAISEFQEVADKYGSPYREKAQYFIAVNRLQIDRTAGIKELEEIASGSGDASILAKFALAQAKSGDGKLDEAAKIYQELSQLENAIISKETIDFELAKIYEKQDKTKEAVDLYFDIANKANEAKDSDGKPLPQSQTAGEAKQKLEELAPERAKEIVVPETPVEGAS